MRDDFSAATKRELGQRVGLRCSNPDCRKPTSGPSENPENSINIGVAAHICAASAGGARFDNTMSSDERAKISNGIWLCQNCAKLIDNNSTAYSTRILKEWKSLAEMTVRIESLGYEVIPSTKTNWKRKLERDMPELIAEMRNDLRANPTTRDFFLKRRNVAYNMSIKLCYIYEDHDDLRGKVRILENFGLIRDASVNSVERFVMEEKFADFLLEV